jgi:hypothetical protein
VKRMTITKYCDRLRSILVRAGGECQLKGLDGRSCFGVLQDMHIVGRTDWELRYDWKRNGLCGCQGHHAFYTYGPQHVWIGLIQTYFPARAKFLFGHHAVKLKADYHSIAKKLERDIQFIAAEGMMHHFYSPPDAKLIDRILKGESLCL